MTYTSDWVALTGNPNSGKTALFNALTGLNHKVSNYPGITVERKMGKGQIGNFSINILDLPGTYSLIPESKDEEVVSKEIKNWMIGDQQPSVIISVVDATNLSRNLYLSSQLLDLDIPVIIALNMMDLVKSKNIEIDLEMIQNELNPQAVIPISARTGEGLPELKKAILNALDKPNVPSDFPIDIPEPVQEAIQPVVQWIENRYRLSKRQSTGIALREITGQSIEHSYLVAEGYDRLKETCSQLAIIGFPCHTLEPTIRYLWLDRVIQQAEMEIIIKSRSEKVDEIITHPWMGPIIFVNILYFIFQSIFTWAAYPMDWIDSSIGWIGHTAISVLPAGLLRDLLVEGIIGGVGAILIFLPQILILIFFLTLLEDTGYMARVAIMTDKLMTKLGLHGRSVLPLMSGYACAIPGIMSTRTIDSWKERLVTMLVLPLISCSARLPVYALMIGAFVPAVTVWKVFNLQGLTMVLMYFLGTATAMILSLVFSRFIKADQKKSFIMELPPYRIPVMQSVFRQVYMRGKLFVSGAGKIIMVVSIILWFLASFPYLDSDEHSIVDSYAAKIAHTIEPAIAPLGFDWKIGVGLITSFAAREVLVSTMATIYNVEDEGDELIKLTDALKNDMNPKTGRHVYSPLVALSLMIFYVYAAQCMATFAIVRRETNSWKWPLFMIVYMTVLAYSASFIVYQGGIILGYS
ncbi:MAG: ferrous iron transport protein B [Candidatus Marinimicrobia bacterium]|nr:ferrous iron transport protein B [Candidatus Neomarinimicrobiota bacterium]